MATLSTSAWVLHDLGLAAGFGGPLFGKIALRRAVKDIGSEAERGKVLSDAWSSYNVLNALALGTAGVTWLIGRSVISGRSIDRTTRDLVIAKDILMGAAVVTGALNMLSGKALREQAPGGAVPTYGGAAPSRRTPRKAAFLQRFLGVMGPVNLALVAGVMGVTTALAMRSGRSARWSLAAKLLP